MIALTNREMNALALVVRKIKLSKEPIELDYVATHMRSLKNNHHAQTGLMRHNHARTIMSLLCLKLKANGIGFERITPLGRGHKALYNFAANTEMKKAEKLLEAYDDK